MPDATGPHEPPSAARPLPRVSIITPSFNQGRFIEATIESVLGQGYPDIEYFVIDGGSTDGTVDILRQFDGRLRWISEPDRGQAHAINKGLRMASGDVIGYLNSDDLYEPGALRQVGSFFAANPAAHWVTGLCRTIDVRGAEIRKPITFYKNLWLRLRSYRALLVLDYVSQPATFWTRNAVETIGEFDESLRYAMDYDYSLRAGRTFRLFVLREYLASFRVHPESKAGSSANAQFDADLAIARRHTDSRLLLALHAVHNALIVAIYRIILWRAARAARARGPAPRSGAGRSRP